MLIPVLAAGLNVIIRTKENIRDFLTLILAVITFICVVNILLIFNSGQIIDFTLFTVMPGLEVGFHVEPLGMLFALTASSLWIVTHVYAIGYMRGNSEDNRSRFFAFFSIAISTVIAISFSKNLFTLFIFYELLTLSTFPLVAHKGTSEALRGARVYLGVLLGSSIGLQLFGIIWIYWAVGTLDFVPGGILAGNFSPFEASILLALFAFGIGKAALMPFHRWLPAAMVAPTPVSALLHAVAVVKAGVFTILKVGVYIFGIDFLDESQASNWLVWVALFSILAASLVAMTKDNLKARLAYSTVSQLSYITLGLGLANSMGALGGSLHIATHAVGKITLFMCAGSIYVATKKTKISEMAGLGRAMPITFFAFFVGSLSIIGLPPLGGSWSKWMLLLSGVEAEYIIVVAALMVSSLLNVLYLMPIVAKGFFGESGDIKAPNSLIGKEAPILCWLPTVLTSFACVVLFIYSGEIKIFLRGIF